LFTRCDIFSIKSDIEAKLLKENGL
jgi:hypothetical protein